MVVAQLLKRRLDGGAIHIDTAISVCNLGSVTLPAPSPGGALGIMGFQDCLLAWLRV